MLAVWDGQSSLCIRSSGQQICLDAATGEGGAPSLEGVRLEAPVEVLLLPLEKALLFPFSLPLPSPKMVDQQILGQELQELTGEDMADWWLSWQAAAVPSGTEGMAIAIPRAAKRQMTQDEAWKRCRLVGVDGWARLEALRPEGTAAGAVVDADNEGVFFGFFRDSNWLGMRRLNRAQSRETHEVVADMLHSLAAMGYLLAEHPLTGMVDEIMQEALRSHGVQWNGDMAEELAGRQQATLEAAGKLQAANRLSGPNFRRADWRFDSGWDARGKSWRRVGVVAAVLASVILASEAYGLYVLQQHEEALRADIESSFRKGLPAERVMLDPLAQLRSAAQGGGHDAGRLLWHLNAVAELKKSEPTLHISKLEYVESSMNLSGTVNDFSAVNRLRDLLGRSTGRNVQLKDTESEGAKGVRFRIQWEFL